MQLFYASSTRENKPPEGLLEKKFFILKASALQNGQAHSNKSPAKAEELFLSVFDHFVGLALKR